MNISVEEKPTGEISAAAGAGTQGGTIGFGVRENNFLGKNIQFTEITVTSSKRFKNWKDHQVFLKKRDKKARHVYFFFGGVGSRCLTVTGCLFISFHLGILQRGLLLATFGWRFVFC